MRGPLIQLTPWLAWPGPWAGPWVRFWAACLSIPFAPLSSFVLGLSTKPSLRPFRTSLFSPQRLRTCPASLATRSCSAAIPISYLAWLPPA
jgi:hypothetical protein